MALSSGATLGPYEIISPLGAGGMGEVYRARDTRLDRTVAIKILPANLAADPKFRERFDREARAISSLNHPHICILYDVGQQDGIHYLVLEHLEGESLSQRLERGPLPLDQVLKYGVQIAEALERAHRQGVVHRDLKPGNVMVTKDGVKLLDFGLAKPLAGASLAASAMSLTVTQGQPLTTEGTIVGTFQYMAPEQLEGRDADPRSDLFAFGCVLYEMAAGKRPFEGKTQASVVAAILATEPPPISSVQPLVPPAFEKLVQTCVAKDPEERWQTAHDVRLQLKWIAEGGSKAGVAAPVAVHRKHREWAAWAITAVCLLLALLGGWTYWRGSQISPHVVRSSILVPENARFTLMARNGAPALSPDGTKLAFVAVRDNRRSIWIRSMDTMDARPLAGGEDGYAPFWSPDGRYLAYFSQGKLKKTAISGGTPENICDADDARGGSWGSKDVIVFTPNRFSGIYSVPATGGTPVPVTELGESLSHRWPHFLPDGEHFLFVSSPIGSASALNKIQVGSVSDKRVKVVLDAAYNTDYANGYLFFLRDGTLNAQPFDPARGQTTGDAVPIAAEVQVDSIYSNALFSVSPSGTLVYAPSSVSNLASLSWFDRHGKELGMIGQPGLFIEVSISPDEKQVSAVEFRQSTIDVWIYELARNVGTRFTTTGSNRYPLWSPDGTSITFASSKPNEKLRIFKKSTLGDNAPEPVISAKDGLIPTDWSPDGKYLTYTTTMTTENKQDIYILPMNGDHQPIPFMQTPFNEKGARISPDGKWIAFTSDESGKYEVYVAPFPAGGRKWQVSSSGGNQPLWARSGSELFYIAPNNFITAVDFHAAGAEPKFGLPNALFKAWPRNFDYSIYAVTRDGRFLISSAPDESNAALSLVSNWPALLKK